MRDGVIPVLSVDEVAEHLGLHEKTVRKMIQRGDLTATRVGRRVLIRQDELQQFIDRHTEHVTLISGPAVVPRPSGGGATHASRAATPNPGGEEPLSVPAGVLRPAPKRQRGPRPSESDCQRTIVDAAHDVRLPGPVDPAGTEPARRLTAPRSKATPATST